MGGLAAPKDQLHADAPIAMVFRERGEHEPAYGRSLFTSKFDFGDRVQIDSDVKGTVIGFCFYPHGSQILVSYWNNGTLSESWLAEWRLKDV